MINLMKALVLVLQQVIVLTIQPINLVKSYI